MSWTGWNNTKFRLWVEIGVPGLPFPVRFDVVKADLTYGVSEIPWCTLQVAMGRNVRTGEIATVHLYADSLKMMLPLIVVMAVEEQANNIGPDPLDVWPLTPFVIFEGYVSGTGFDLARSRGATFTIGGLHWLANLQFSSCLTNRLSAVNAASLATPAAQQVGDLPPDGVGPPHFVAATTGGRFVTEANLKADVWSRVLHPWLQEIAKTGPLQLAGVPPGVIGQNPQAATNAQALESLARFEPFFSLSRGLPPFPYWVPMMFNDALTGAVPFRESLASHLGKETVASNASYSFWDKIVGSYAGDFLAMLVPMAQSAMFVPMLTTLTGWYTTVWPHEYEGIQVQTRSPRPLRAVCLLRGKAQDFVAGKRGQAGLGVDVGGYFENPTFPDGMVLFEQLPPWIANLTQSTTWGFASANPHNVRGRADAPGVGPGAVDMGLPDARVLKALGKNLWDRYAQAVYVNQVVKDRTGFINGKVRFDIAPGSNLRIVCMEEQFVAQELNPLGLPLYALYVFVHKVTHTLNAESMFAETRLEFSHVRNDGEFLNPFFSAAGHPLYAFPWPGGPLVNHVAFHRPLGS